MAIDILAPDPIDTPKGDALVAALFGSPEHRRAVVHACAQQSGIAEASLERVLPILAMLVGGYLVARASGWAREESSPVEASA